MVEGGWAELPDELVEKVLELLQAAGRSEPQDEGLGSFQPLPRCGWCALRGRPCTMRW
jgi:hypothetical protein